MPRSGVGSRGPRGQSLSVRFQRLGWTPRLVRPDLGECWEWNGHRDIRHGYGRFVAPEWTNAAHRFAYSEFSGIIPGLDMHICHRCDNPPCIRPSHLFAGTRSANMRDMVAKGRHPYEAVTKLTDAQVAEIRSRPSGAWGAKAAMAREFGVSGNHISYIINGKRRAA